MDKLIKYIAGEATDAEKKEIEALLHTDAEIRKQAEQLQAIWDNAPESTVNQVDTDKAWQNIQAQIGTSNAEKSAKITAKSVKVIRKKRTRWRTWSRVAAVLCLGMGLTYLVYNQYFKGEESVSLAESSGDSIKNLTLIDGSKITLNKNSTLNYPQKFEENIRKVTLEGEAFFEIEHIDNQPFIIQAGKTEIRVLGTKFNVSTHKKDTVTVTVEKGKVAFYPSTQKRKKVILTKGEKGVFSAKSVEVIETKNQSLNTNAWRTKLLRFEDAPMNQVAQQLNDFYDLEITVSESLKNCRLTAKFSEKSVDEVLETIGFMFEVKVEKLDKKIILTGGNCTP